jgi:hypothetical protein
MIAQNCFRTNGKAGVGSELLVYGCQGNRQVNNSFKGLLASSETEGRGLFLMGS